VALVTPLQWYLGLWAGCFVTICVQGTWDDPERKVGAVIVYSAISAAYGYYLLQTLGVIPRA
jgi:hypothetical protein